MIDLACTANPAVETLHIEMLPAFGNEMIELSWTLLEGGWGI